MLTNGQAVAESYPFRPRRERRREKRPLQKPSLWHEVAQ